jgi:hypothetical protein
MFVASGCLFLLLLNRGNVQNQRFLFFCKRGHEITKPANQNEDKEQTTQRPPTNVGPRVAHTSSYIERNLFLNYVGLAQYTEIWNEKIEFEMLCARKVLITSLQRPLEFSKIRNKV